MPSPRVALACAVFALACAGGSSHQATPAPADAGPIYVVDTVARGLRNPWSLAFLPDGGMIVTEKYGGLRHYRKESSTAQDIQGAPASFQKEDGGLLDIVLDPRFTDNRLVYVSFTEGDSSANHTAIFRGRLENDRLIEGRVIFRATPDKVGMGHPGGRMVFLPDETLLLTIGDGYDFRDEAQNLGSSLGKIVRLDREGRPPETNPFVGRPGALPAIFSYGHRNPQGLLVDPRDGTAWEHEHGPRGGDEINRLQPGLNYGWPRTTFGIDYSGELVLGVRALPGRRIPRMER